MNDPELPFEPLVFENDTYTFSGFTKLVLFTDDPEALLFFNQFFGNTQRCSLTETPCGGAKNVRFPDMFPGTVSIESGEYCYLKSSGGHVGKTLSAGHLAESQEIITSGSGGIAYCLANGEEYLMANGDSYLVTPPNQIVSKFQIFNVSVIARLCRLLIRCPNSVSSVKLYNRDTRSYDDTIFVQTPQEKGTVNAYDMYRIIGAHTAENIQIMVEYNDLSWTYGFETSEHKAQGLWNINTFMAFYDPSTKNVYYLLFTKLPENLTCNIDASGNVTAFTIPKSDTTIYYGKIKYAKISQLTGDVPTCFDPSTSGSLAEFLKRYFALIDIQPNIELKTYVVPAISDNKILPATNISNAYLSNSISCRVCPGEYHPESFVLRSDKDITLTIEVSDLVSGNNTISSSAIDLRYVDCWYQAGYENKNTHKLGRFITPELLTYDPELVRTNCDEWESDHMSNPYAKNELKLQDGSYIDITSSATSSNSAYKPTVAERPVYDADTLQPLYLKKNLNKQVWITVNPQVGSTSGTYISTIYIKSGSTILKTITLSVEVLPITLLDASVDYGIYYRGKLATDDVGTISSETKSQAQFLADHQNMVQHGIKCPQMMEYSSTLLPATLSLRASCGISNSTLLFNGAINIDDSIADIQAWKDTCTANGVSQLYIYGHDESNMTSLISKMTAIHNIGVKIFCAQNPTYGLAVKDYLDLCIGNSAYTAAQIAEFKATGHKIYSYGNPQTVVEFPLTFRRNYGLFLWQMGYDGAFPYAYQHSYWDIWSDFDAEMYRDHCFTYPTVDKPLDTVQYEGFREGVTDMRYLATLLDVIETAKLYSISTSSIETWLDTLKTTDLSTVDLNSVRGQMITYIIQLQEALA